MILLEFTRIERDLQTGEIYESLLACVKINPLLKTYTTEGDGRYFDTSICVPDFLTGEKLTFFSNPVLWAQNLHLEYRSDVAVHYREVMDA